jgi:hypothetical protein
MIKYKGSKTGVTLAAEVNLKQKDINAYGEENQINYDRLDDTSIPVNSVYVESNVADGYIDVVYFTDEKPIDSCIEYVRPLGMYCFQHAGVVQNARTKLGIDVRLTDEPNMTLGITATQVGRYSREDYASLQATENGELVERHPAYIRNSVAEITPTQWAGYRSLCSLQLTNNHNIDNLLRLDPPIFSQGYFPQDYADINDVDIDVVMAQGYTVGGDAFPPEWNLLYDRIAEEDVGPDITTIDTSRTPNRTHPKPAVNPIMTQIGDALSMNDYNTEYANRTPKSNDKVEDRFPPNTNNNS